MVLTTVVCEVAAAAADDSPEWRMIHSLRQRRGSSADSIGVFTPLGPDLSTMQPAPRRVDYVAYDPQSGTYFGQQTSSIGQIDDKGKLHEIAMPPDVRLSHPGGLAFDSARRSLLVASRDGGGTVIYEYFLDENRWEQIGNIGREELLGLAVDPDSGLFYTLERPVHETACSLLRVCNRKGAVIQAIELSEPIPMYSQLQTKLQLVLSDGALYAMTSHEHHPRVVNRIFQIDPASGQTLGTSFNADIDLFAETWPGWDGGPPPSKANHTGPERGSDFDSNYQTPRHLVARQRGELHVIAVQSGGLQYLDWLKKIKNVNVSVKNDSVSLGVELDSKEQAPPVVEVQVNPSDEPITLALNSAAAVTWSIKPESGARIDRVYLFGSPWGKSQVIGVAQELIVDGAGKAPAAYAWELDRTSSAVGFDEMIASIRKMTGLRENSFQGALRGQASSRRSRRKRERPDGWTTLLSRRSGSSRLQIQMCVSSSNLRDAGAPTQRPQVVRRDRRRNFG